MAVDIKKQTVIQVIHGVQTTDDSSDLNQHKDIEKLVTRSLGGKPFDFRAEMYRYEDINDKVTDLFENLFSALVSNKIASAVMEKVVDLVGDVVINLKDGSVAADIRNGFKEAILEHYENGNPCYVVAHSLGTIYAFDVINELISDPAYFKRDDRTTWPVQGFITLGSPIGLGLFKGGHRDKVQNLGRGAPYFTWKNYFDLTDPIVSGNVFGKASVVTKQIAEKYMESNSDQQGWFCEDFATDTGKSWLIAHTAYWNDFTVGQGIVSMLPNV